MSTIGDVLLGTAKRLEKVSETPRLDAEILLACALGINRAHLMARLRDAIEVPALFEEYIRRRESYEPLAYILGEWEFFSLRFKCKKPIFVPRPETEILVERVLEELDDLQGRVLDVGAGTGCVGIAIAANNPQVTVVALDKNPDALDLVQTNARLHSVEERVRAVCSDGLSAFSKGGHFDVVCSNPPYVETSVWNDISPVIRFHEDSRAILSGIDGLEFIRQLIRDAKGVLRDQGVLAFEIGCGQKDAVYDILLQMGYTCLSSFRDLSGIDRVITARNSCMKW
ncbi:MAG TPA: peptide chain release factor N(5)-glutamine methyltransferase [Candidatus Hydrogenedentes bacterium]|nr:peptide chain release factor N(5)-glutamine methyltransferase [Candidatus Hydrogenedentota bacterium]HOL75764.1 peptide chain release factor N(5)-glutamine methyltransferase [Candidatus Hydrogenedentota bacterium]